MPGRQRRVSGQIASLRSPTCVAMIALLLALLGPAAARSDIKLRNSTIEITGTSATPSPKTFAVYNASTVALGQVPTLALNLISGLTNATNPLDSFANIELALRNNNTFLITNSTSVGLSRSTLGLGAGTWLLVSNGSSLTLNDSRLALNSSSGWLSDSSTTSISNSVVGLQDATALWSNSAVNVENSTVSLGAGAYEAPVVTTDSYPYALFVGGSAINIAGTSWTARNIPIVFDASNISLSNSTITLYNARLVLNAANVVFSNAEILLYNSTLSLLQNSTFNYPVSNVTVYKAYNTSLPSLVLPLTNGTSASVPAGPEQALVGYPLGLVNNVTITSADAGLIFSGF